MRRSVLGTTSLRMHFLSFPSLLESSFDWRSSFLFWRFSFRFCLSEQTNQSSKSAAKSAEVLCHAHKCRLLGPKWLSWVCDSLNSACCLPLCYTETSTEHTPIFVRFCKYLQRQTSDRNTIKSILGVSQIKGCSESSLVTELTKKLDKITVSGSEWGRQFTSWFTEQFFKRLLKKLFHPPVLIGAGSWEIKFRRQQQPVSWERSTGQSVG